MIELHQAEGCPHCAKVRNALTELGLSYVAHNHDSREGRR